MTDLISRQAVLKELPHALWGKEWDEVLAKAIIESVPSIEPKRGKWEETGDKGGRNYACNCCRFAFIMDTCMGEPMWNYCPNCGARMDL